ncbi:hypothetical protein STTU_0593 [Streptomyces sp. Tu6071]|nr:hypothetical protein STTU_0593 [Streptomyces sp. Tu6071]
MLVEVGPCVLLGAEDVDAACLLGFRALRPQLPDEAGLARDGVCQFFVRRGRLSAERALGGKVDLDEPGGLVGRGGRGKGVIHVSPLR